VKARTARRSYRSASAQERRRVHAELEHSASRAQARGGLAAAAAFLERATLLTREATARGEGIAMAVTAHSEALLYKRPGPL
jgi:hypothetical protein